MGCSLYSFCGGFWTDGNEYSPVEYCNARHNKMFLIDWFNVLKGGKQLLEWRKIKNRAICLNENKANNIPMAELKEAFHTAFLFSAEQINKFNISKIFPIEISNSGDILDLEDLAKEYKMKSLLM